MGIWAVPKDALEITLENLSTENSVIKMRQRNVGKILKPRRYVEVKQGFIKVIDSYK